MKTFANNSTYELPETELTNFGHVFRLNFLLDLYAELNVGDPALVYTVEMSLVEECKGFGCSNNYDWHKLNTAICLCLICTG